MTRSARQERPANGLPTIELCGMSLAAVDAAGLLDHIFSELHAGRGGWVVTANLDILRRFVREPEVGRTYALADITVADGMPLVWASSLRGTPLPERVAGSSLLEPLCARACAEQRSVYLLGGDPEAAETAARKLRERHPDLKLVGQSSPWVSAPPTTEELAPIEEALTRRRPDIVLVAFGSPKQEQVIAALRARLPASWWLGIGVSLSFLSGHVQRAPLVMQRLGLEWAHRLAQEPRRLFRRYLVDDLPFAVELFGRAAADRLRRRIVP